MKSKAILNINLITVKELNIEQELNTELKNGLKKG